LPTEDHLSSDRNIRRTKRFNADRPRACLRTKTAERHGRATLRTLAAFPAFTYPTLLRHGQTIDVSWFNARGLPDAFFEVENTTDMKNSLLKFVELQDFRTGFHIVADGARRAEYRQRLGLAAFAPLRERVRFWDYAALATLHDKELEARAVEGSSSAG